jgi:hypothetical protein
MITKSRKEKNSFTGKINLSGSAPKAEQRLKEIIKKCSPIHAHTGRLDFMQKRKCEPHASFLLFTS